MASYSISMANGHIHLYAYDLFCSPIVDTYTLSTNSEGVRDEQSRVTSVVMCFSKRAQCSRQINLSKCSGSDPVTIGRPTKSATFDVALLGTAAYSKLSPNVLRRIHSAKVRYDVFRGGYHITQGSCDNGNLLCTLFPLHGTNRKMYLLVTICTLPSIMCSLPIARIYSTLQHLYTKPRQLKTKHQRCCC